jgi:hypothetical protein
MKNYTREELQTLTNDQLRQVVLEMDPEAPIHAEKWPNDSLINIVMAIQSDAHIHRWARENWTVGQYTPSVAFSQISNHSCVCKPNKELISVNGEADDLESQKLSDLFSQAPKLYLMLQYLFMETRLEIPGYKNDEIVKLLKLSRGET